MLLIRGTSGNMNFGEIADGSSLNVGAYVGDII